MSAGPGAAVGAPPGPARSVTLAALEKELWHAVDAREEGYASELRARIARLSQGSAENPAMERAAAPRPAANRRKR